MIKQKKPIVLASASPRRIELLRQWGLSFIVKPSHVSEETAQTAPSRIVKELALRKARATAETLSEGIVIGADTIVVLKREIIGKPQDTADALRILTSLNGSFHRVYSGVAVVDAATGASRVSYDVSRVLMRKFSPAELRRLAGKHMDKAGAYAVQEEEDAFVERIEGEYFTVVGLPQKVLAEVLRHFGVVLTARRRNG